MNVSKRNGEQETVSFDKILQRMKLMGPDIKVNYTALAMKVIDQLYDGISTKKIDELCAEQCASMASIHYDYNTLAGRIMVSNHHKNTSSAFDEVMETLYSHRDIHGQSSPLVSHALIDFVRENKDVLNELCDYSRDFLIDYFGFKTLDRAYLIKVANKTVERPQHMWLRVSIGIHQSNLSDIIETYHLMSQKYFTHATPTLFNAGTLRPQLSSCFLLSMENDSIEGIYNTLKDCALISKHAGGIGLHIHNIRATGSYIRGTNGNSNGIVPMLKVFNHTAKYVDQCVHPDTIIYTDEGPIPIRDCVSGKTRVFNRTGKLETVETVLEHFYDGPLIVLRNSFSPKELYITPKHPVYVIREDETEPEWVEAGELLLTDSVVYVKPEYVNDVANISTEDCEMYVYIYLFGGLNAIGKYYIDKTSVPEDSKVMGFVYSYLVTNCVKYNDDANIIFWDPAIHLPFRNGDFYRNGEKKVHCRWMFLPNPKLSVLYTLFLKYDTLNTESVFLHWLKLRIRWVSPILTNTITSISQLHYKGVLYDLQMKEQHNYLLENGLVHNGGGKRNGSFAIYLEPWHPDIEVFLQLRKNHGDEELKARDLFYALWIPDLFMERVKENGTWSLFCPDECPGLAEVYGYEFRRLYESYESSGRGKTVNARELWFKVLDSQMETGMPYILFKDACNEKSNQKNVGTIKSSNLCSEIIQYSDNTESAVCNLASIGLPTFVEEDGRFDYEKLHEVAKVITRNLNKIIDINYYPTEKTRKSNMRHRPIGIGVQGLADVFMLMGYPFLSDDSKEVNRNIFETIYHGALEASCELAERNGAYETFAGSPASHGILQFDMWGVSPTRYDWDALKTRIRTHGLRNSLLLAPMPTASTSQILGFNECIEPITSNIYSRRTIAGEFIQANKYMMQDLMQLGLWNEKIKNNIIANHGSLQHIDVIPQEVKDKYRTVWEIPMRHLIDMAADRGAFICQSQSLNLWLEDPTYNTLTSMHFYSWQKGLKTGIYYLRRRGKHQAQQFTIEPEKASLENSVENEICDMCSS
uniref:ribonucleoside-diphosphate reductase n=1 Tax=viral metagenome TaxID=1070528 RepID=A0A6C0DYA8_9ZZZZ